MTALAWKIWISPSCDVHRDDAVADAVVGDEQVEHLEFVEELDVVLDALLVEGVEDHVAGAVG